MGGSFEAEKEARQPRVDLPSDLRDRNVEIRISSDGKTLWINTAEDGCVLRICKVGALVVADDRSVALRSRQTYAAEEVADGQKAT